jgi:hypothetical protein
MRIKTEIDLSYKIIIILTIFVTSLSVLVVPYDQIGLILIFVIPTNLLLIWFVLDTWYELCDEYLLCVSGPMREKIYYDRIKSIALTENMLSSMALSRKRIEIRQYHKNFFTGTTYISPTDREEFYRDLKRYCKNLEPI